MQKQNLLHNKQILIKYQTNIDKIPSNDSTTFAYLITINNNPIYPTDKIACRIPIVLYFTIKTKAITKAITTRQ